MARRPRKTVPPVKQVKLKLVHIDFWSAVRMTFWLMLAIGVATMVGFLLLWVVMSFTGLGNSVNNLLAGVGLVDPTTSTNPLTTLGKFMGFSFGLAVFNMIVGSLVAGVWALIYNLIARFSGGLSVGFTNN